MDELLELDVIEKVNEPCQWISPMVIDTKKDQDIRICIDMRRANKAIKREIYPLPTIEGLLPKVYGSTIFSTIDVKNAFHQIEIASSSRYITTFITNRGLYRYKRLMFGISCAPEIFQKTMEKILIGCDGAEIYMDDILIHGKDDKQHSERLEIVQKRLKEYNVLLNKTKCIYGKREVVFLGFKISVNGINITEEKLKAVKSFRPPKDVDELRSFLGLVNYVGRFIPNLAEINAPLRQMLKKTEKFEWDKTRELAFQLIKKKISQNDSLGFYNPLDRTQVMADAGPSGLGAVLIQFNKQGVPRIISYGSKSLSEVERRYAQTEKEALALVWSVEKFHMYLYGKTFELVTDHRPLEVIFSTTSKPCARIQRWVLRLQSYDYKVIYQPGKNNIADPLSRMSVTDPVKQSFDEITELHVRKVVEWNCPKAITQREMEKYSNEDTEIQEIKHALHTGKWQEALRKYEIIQTELCFSGDILLRGNRLVIPEKLKERTIDLSHEGHPGIVVMKRRLRSKVWWHGIDQMAEKKVKGCMSCLRDSLPNAPHPMKSRDLPAAPWIDIVIDFLGPLPSGEYVFVIVDFYSRYYEVEFMRSITSLETIKRLRTIFARFGIPATISSDNGRQFISDEFKEFCTELGIKLNNGVPYWPQMQGEVERQNRSILKILRICQSEKKDLKEELEKYLLMYRSTAHSITGKSPSEMFFGWNIKDKLPSIRENFRPYDEEVRDKDRERKDKNTTRTNEKRRAKEIEFEQGNVVLRKKLKENKLDQMFGEERYEIISKTGADIVIKNQKTGKLSRCNGAHLKQIEGKKQDQELNKESEEKEDKEEEKEDEEEEKIVERPKRSKKIPVKLRD